MTKHLTSQAILEKAIQQAIDNGFEPLYQFSYKEKLGADGFEVSITGNSVDWHRAGKVTVREDAIRLIFNHDFAKALWGELRFEKGKSQVVIPGWKDRLMKMAVSKDPIKYLGSTL